MKLVIVAVGRVKEVGLRELLDEYYGRTRRYAELVEHEIKDDREDRVIAAFDAAIAKAGPRAELVALEVGGDALSSEGFSRRVDDAWQRSAVLVFAIGGSEGLPRAVSSRARWRLSLGSMTLPHRLARLVLAEQVYRAFTILKGEPYNK